MLSLIALAVLLMSPSVMSRPAVLIGGGKKVIKLNVVADSWIDDTSTNHNSDAFLSIGHLQGTQAKRALLKFEDIPPNECSENNIISASMFMYFQSAYRDQSQSSLAPYIAYSLEVHAVTADWVDNQVSGQYRKTNTAWSSAMLLGQNGQDAEVLAQAPPMTMFPLAPARTVEFDVTNSVRHWKGGQLTNNGLLVRAINENTQGVDLRFSSQSDANKHAVIIVLCNI